MIPTAAETAGPPGVARVTLLTRVGCHLCERARQVVSQVAGPAGVGWTERDVDADDDDRAEYGDLVPVVLVDGIMHGYHDVDPDRLRAAIDR